MIYPTLCPSYSGCKYEHTLILCICLILYSLFIIVFFFYLLQSYYDDFLHCVSLFQTVSMNTH